MWLLADGRGASARSTVCAELERTVRRGRRPANDHSFLRLWATDPYTLGLHDALVAG